MLGPREDERLVDATGRDEEAQQFTLALTVDGMDDLRDEFRGGVAGRDLDRRGSIEEVAGEPPDLVTERGREQQVLALGRQDREDLADVADEAHVQHAVRLVQDEDLDPGQVDRALAEVVQQAAGRRDHDLRPGAQRTDLRVEPDAAVDRRRADRARGAVGPDALLHLERELTGRGQDEGADRRSGRVAAIGGPGLGPGRSASMQELQHRQHEGSRLARPGLGPGEDVAALQDQRDRLPLDGGGFRVALVGDSTEKLGRQPKGIEGHEGNGS